MQADSCTNKQNIVQEKAFLDHNSKGLLAEDMQSVIQKLSNELSEAREVLRQKKNILNAQFYELNKDENDPKREFEQFIDKISSTGKESYQPNIICNSTKLNMDSEVLDNKKPSKPKVNFDALKRLLVVVNKINKTYDPIRI